MSKPAVIENIEIRSEPSVIENIEIRSEPSVIENIEIRSENFESSRTSGDEKMSFDNIGIEQKSKHRASHR